MKLHTSHSCFSISFACSSCLLITDRPNLRQAASFFKGRRWNGGESSIPDFVRRLADAPGSFDNLPAEVLFYRRYKAVVDSFAVKTVPVYSTRPIRFFQPVIRGK